MNTHTRPAHRICNGIRKAREVTEQVRAECRRRVRALLAVASNETEYCCLTDPKAKMDAIQDAGDDVKYLRITMPADETNEFQRKLYEAIVFPTIKQKELTTHHDRWGSNLRRASRNGNP